MKIGNGRKNALLFFNSSVKYADTFLKGRKSLDAQIHLQFFAWIIGLLTNWKVCQIF